MGRLVCVLFFVLVSPYAIGQESIRLADLVGKWKLVKIEEVQVQGDAELNRQTYTPSTYSGDIFFEEVEIGSDKQIHFTGKRNAELGSTGNLQFQDGSTGIIFHSSSISLDFDIGWVVYPTTILLSTTKLVSQQSGAKVTVRYNYQKVRK